MRSCEVKRDQLPDVGPNYVVREVKMKNSRSYLGHLVDFQSEFEKMAPKRSRNSQQITGKLEASI